MAIKVWVYCMRWIGEWVTECVCEEFLMTTLAQKGHYTSTAFSFILWCVGRQNMPILSSELTERCHTVQVYDVGMWHDWILVPLLHLWQRLQAGRRQQHAESADVPTGHKHSLGPLYANDLQWNCSWKMSSSLCHRLICKSRQWHLLIKLYTMWPWMG